MEESPATTSLGDQIPNLQEISPKTNAAVMLTQLQKFCVHTKLLSHQTTASHEACLPLAESENLRYWIHKNCLIHLDFHGICVWHLNLPQLIFFGPIFDYRFLIVEGHIVCIFIQKLGD